MAVPIVQMLSTKATQLIKLQSPRLWPRICQRATKSWGSCLWTCGLNVWQKRFSEKRKRKKFEVQACWVGCTCSLGEPRMVAPGPFLQLLWVQGLRPPKNLRTELHVYFQSRTRSGGGERAAGREPWGASGLPALFLREDGEERGGRVREGDSRAKPGARETQQPGRAQRPHATQNPLFQGAPTTVTYFPVPEEGGACCLFFLRISGLHHPPAPCLKFKSSL